MTARRMADCLRPTVHGVRFTSFQFTAWGLRFVVHYSEPRVVGSWLDVGSAESVTANCKLGTGHSRPAAAACAEGRGDAARASARPGPVSSRCCWILLIRFW